MPISSFFIKQLKKHPTALKIIRDHILTLARDAGELSRILNDIPEKALPLRFTINDYAEALEANELDALDEMLFTQMADDLFDENGMLREEIFNFIKECDESNVIPWQKVDKKMTAIGMITSYLSEIAAVFVDHFEKKKTFAKRPRIHERIQKMHQDEYSIDDEGANLSFERVINPIPKKETEENKNFRLISYNIVIVNHFTQFTQESIDYFKHNKIPERKKMINDNFMNRAASKEPFQTKVLNQHVSRLLAIKMVDILQTTYRQEKALRTKQIDENTKKILDKLHGSPQYPIKRKHPIKELETFVTNYKDTALEKLDDHMNFAHHLLESLKHRLENNEPLSFKHIQLVYNTANHVAFNDKEPQLTELSFRGTSLFFNFSSLFPRCSLKNMLKNIFKRKAAHKAAVLSPAKELFDTIKTFMQPKKVNLSKLHDHEPILSHPRP